MKSSDQIWRLVKSGGPRVVELKAGVGIPLFLIHGAGGDINGFQAIADQMQICGPIYGIQARRSDMRNETNMTVKDIGHIYARLIRNATSSRSFFIVGYSCGAVLALETSQILIAGGNLVPLLVAIDGAPLFGRRDIMHRLQNAIGWLYFTTSSRIDLPRATMKLPYADLFRIIRLAKKGVSAEHQTYMMSLLKSVCLYAPNKYEGECLLLKCSEQSKARSHQLSAAWRSFAKDCTSLIIKGRHCDIAAGEKAVVEECARAIDQALAKHTVSWIKAVREIETLSVSLEATS